MAIALDLNDMGTLVGLVVGTAGSVLGVMNYLRDRPRVKVELKWDMTVMNLPEYDPNRPWGLIRVANVGRRPIYVSHVAIRLPKGFEDTHLVLMDGIRGQKLAEGDAPLTYPVSQEGLEAYAKHWKKLRAQVSDSAGKVWRSPRPRKERAPSWAERSDPS